MPQINLYWVRARVCSFLSALSLLVIGKMTHLLNIKGSKWYSFLLNFKRDLLLLLRWSRWDFTRGKKEKRGSRSSLKGRYWFFIIGSFYSRRASIISAHRKSNSFNGYDGFPSNQGCHTYNNFVDVGWLLLAGIGCNLRLFFAKKVGGNDRFLCSKSGGRNQKCSSSPSWPKSSFVKKNLLFFWRMIPENPETLRDSNLFKINDTRAP